MMEAPLGDRQVQADTAGSVARPADRRQSGRRATEIHSAITITWVFAVSSCPVRHLRTKLRTPGIGAPLAGTARSSTSLRPTSGATGSASSMSARAQLGRLRQRTRIGLVVEEAMGIEGELFEEMGGRGLRHRRASSSTSSPETRGQPTSALETFAYAACALVCSAARSLSSCCLESDVLSTRGL
jgi:hypothetical protein